jgi:hypothetical protein
MTGSVRRDPSPYLAPSSGVPRNIRSRISSLLAATAGLGLMLTMAASPSLAQAAETPALEQADVESALVTAKKTGERVRISDATTDRAEYFATPDGKVTGTLSAGPVRFLRDNKWVPVDLTLRKQADGSIAPTSHGDDVRISGARAAAGDLASMGTGAEKVTMGWEGALPEPKLDGSKATYSEVLPGVDLVVQVTASGFEQYTVVKSAAAAKYVKKISLPLAGLGVASATVENNGRMKVLGSGGRQQAEIPTPMMWDSRSATRGGPLKPRRVTVDRVNTNAASTDKATAATAPVTLNLAPDQQWLTAPDTVYPVIIDPYVDWSTTAASTTVVKGYSTGWPTADSLFVGTADSTFSARSFVTWYANALQGKWVESATANFANPYSNSCNQTPWQMWATGPITSSTSWANQPAWQTLEETSTETSCADGWVTADATSFLRQAVDKGIATPTMGLRAENEADYTQYKQFWSNNSSDQSKIPYIEVTYSDKPASGATAADASAMRAQEKFLQAADKISNAVTTSNPPGFTSIELTTSQVTLRWKGTIPADIQTAISQARAIAPVGVSQAAYSLAELEARAEPIRTEMDAETSAIQTLSIPVDGSGVVVGTADGTEPTSSIVNDPSSSVPVAVVKADSTATMAGPSTRTNDGWNGTKPSSFAGGGMILGAVPGTTNLSKCTAGFGVTNGSEEFLLTASHCGYPNQTWQNGNRSRTIGKVSHEWVSRDLMLIRTDANRFMWDGGATSGSFTKTVTGWRKAYVGQQVCLSGATTGTHCGWKNTRDLAADFCSSKPDVYSGKKECYHDLIVARSSTLKGGPGDSGGPIFVTDGGPTVQAVGTLTGGGVFSGGDNAMFYQDFWTANRQWNIRPIT